MRRIGLQNVRLIETPGNPVVYGDWLGAPGAPTILFYGHYDVQPVDPLDLWESPPFEATIRDGEIYARGSADDKGQVFMHFKAVEAHLKQNGRLPVNIKFILEGEEEVGSVNLDDFIRAHKSRARRPTSSSSPTRRCSRAACRRSATACAAWSTSRSICAAAAPTCTPGSFGGAVANPAFVLAQMIAQMKDRSGRIKIPGFYDDVRPLQEEERKAWATLPFNEKKYRKDFGIPKLFGETGYTTLERTWARPTFEVNGLLSGFTGEGAKTVLPAVAMAKVSMRLVPNQDPDKIARSVRGVRAEDRAEDRRAEGHAHARRQAVDDVVRQPVRAGRRPRDRAGLRPASRCSRAKADRFRWCRRSRRSSACRRCCSASACRTRTRTRRTRSSTSATSTTASSRRRISTRRSRRRRCRPDSFDSESHAKRDPEGLGAT